MDRIADLVNCEQVEGSADIANCNHVGFLDRYEWGYWCGNCGAAFKFIAKEGDK